MLRADENEDAILNFAKFTLGPRLAASFHSEWPMASICCLPRRTCQLSYRPTKLDQNRASEIRGKGRGTYLEECEAQKRPATRETCRCVAPQEITQKAWAGRTHAM